MRDPAPGRLVALPARDVWGDEARVFTPWRVHHGSPARADEVEDMPG